MIRRIAAIHLVPSQTRAAAPACTVLPVEVGAVTAQASSVLLKPDAVAARLGVTAKVLERWRGTGAGPAFVRLSRKSLRYRAGDVESFIAARVRFSTSNE